MRFVYTLVITSILILLSIGSSYADNRCGAFSTSRGDPLYVGGFYPGWLLDAGNASPGDSSKWCSVNGTFYYNNDVQGPAAGAAAAGQRTWTCRDNLQVNQGNTINCSAIVKARETPTCGGADVFDKQPVNNLLNPLCRGVNVQTQVIPGTPLFQFVGGGNDQKRQWKCSGNYYNEVTCEKASQAVCGSAENKQFDTLSTDSADLCANGKVLGFTFSESTYVYARTCQGSEQQYSVECSALKTANNPVCSNTFNNRAFDTLEEQAAMCSNGEVVDFSENTNQDGRTRGCRGEPITNISDCSASKTISRGICAAGITNSEVAGSIATVEGFKAQYSDSDLCQVGNPTLIKLEGTQRKRSCTGTRPQDSTACQARRARIVGECSSTNGKTFSQLSTTDNLCANSLQAKDFVYNDTTFTWSWNCQGSENTVACNAKKQSAGVCNTNLQGKIVTYDIIKQETKLCDIGTPDINTLGETPVDGQRKRNCRGPNSGPTTACSAFSKTDAVCNSFPEPRSVMPSPLCQGGMGTNILQLDNKRVWECKGLNGGTSQSCESLCENNQCLRSQCNGTPTNVNNGQVCNDCDGCVCGGRRIFNGVACTQDTTQTCTNGQLCDNQAGCTLSGFGFAYGQLCVANDALLTTVNPEDMCIDPDGCLCNNEKIPAGNICLSDGKSTIGDGDDCLSKGGCICGDYQVYAGEKCRVTDGTVPPIENGDICSNENGCLCGEYKIYLSKLCQISNGTRSPIDLGGTCTDPDGCQCNDIVLQNGNICMPADGQKTNVQEGLLCQDPDGCECFSITIVAGSQCTKELSDSIIKGEDDGNAESRDYILPMFRPTFGPGQDSFGFGSLYDPSVMLPGEADISIIHSALQSTGTRGAEIGFRVSYKNDGPDVAVGTYLAYKISDLFMSVTGTIPYTMMPASLSGTVDTSILYFYIGHLRPGETGQIIISGYVKESLMGDTVQNTAQIQSRLMDSNPLNNTKTANISLTKRLFTPGLTNATYLINPLLPLKNMIDKYTSLVQRVGAKTDFRDIITGHPFYMHIMTVQRNGLMKGYEYQFSTMFSPKKCITRLEYLVIMARMMHMQPQNNVMASPHKTTPYIDVPQNITIVKYINRVHSRGLVDIFKAGKSDPNILGINKNVSHKEAKAVLNRLYVLMNADATVLKPLLVGDGDAFSASCLTREETAYTLTHILRGNPDIVMGFNDVFLGRLYKLLQPMSVAKRREALQRLIFRLKMVSPALLFQLGLDGETLLGALESSMKGEEFSPQYTTSSVQNFFYEITEDEYDNYIKTLYGKK